MSKVVGISSAEIRTLVVPYIHKEIKPRVVFDLGMGIGIYGYGLRMLDPKIVLVGLDGYLPYLQHPVAQEIYVARIHAPIEAILQGKFPLWGDVVICMDVIEHFEKETALKLLDTLRQVPMPAIISTPLFEYPQESVDGNPLEEHKCWFSKRELEDLGWRTLFKVWYELDGQTGFIGAFQNE